MRTRKRTATILMRFTLKEKQKSQKAADELELPASELMRLSMRAGLAKIRRQLADSAMNHD